MRTPTVFIPSGRLISYEIATFGLGNMFTGGHEASPIYTGITVTRSGSGARSKPGFTGSTTTQSINYSISHTYNRSSQSGASYSFLSMVSISDGSIDSFAVTRPYNENEVDFLTHAFGATFPPRNVANPKKHYLMLHQAAEENIIYGTETEADLPPVDLSADFTMWPPAFDYLNPSPTLPDVLPVEYDAWACKAGIGSGSTVKLDVTGFSATKWRDLRGAYTLAIDDVDIDPSWDNNSVVHTVEWTIF